MNKAEKVIFFVLLCVSVIGLSAQSKDNVPAKKNKGISGACQYIVVRQGVYARRAGAEWRCLFSPR